MFRVSVMLVLGCKFVDLMVWLIRFNVVVVLVIFGVKLFLLFRLVDSFFFFRIDLSVWYILVF